MPSGQYLETQLAQSLRAMAKSHWATQPSHWAHRCLERGHVGSLGVLLSPPPGGVCVCVHMPAHACTRAHTRSLTPAFSCEPGRGAGCWFLFPVSSPGGGYILERSDFLVAGQLGRAPGPEARRP